MDWNWEADRHHQKKRASQVKRGEPHHEKIYNSFGWFLNSKNYYQGIICERGAFITLETRQEHLK